MTTRREFLSASVTAAIAASTGCLDVVASANEHERVLQLTLNRKDGSLRDHHVVDLSETRPEWSEEAFETTLNGSTYTTQYRKPFFARADDPKYAKRDGVYYELGSVVVDEVEETRPVLRLYTVDTSENDSQANGVESETLPDGDQHAIHIAHMAARARGNKGGVPWGLVQRGGYVYRQEEAINASHLLSEDRPDHVKFRDNWYAVEVTDEQFHEPVYRATVEPVADSADQMEAILRVQVADARIRRDEVTTDVRDILLSARGDGYSEAHPYSAEYQSVLTGLNERAFLDGNIENDANGRENGTGTLLYGDTYFSYFLSFRTDAD